MQDLHNLFRAASIVFIFEIILSLMEVFTDFRLPISRYSDMANYFGRESILTKEVLENNDLQYMFSMPTGFHWNPNNLSAVMVIVFPFFLNYKRPIVALIGSIAIVTIIVASGARICFLALCLVFLFRIILIFKRKELQVWLTGLVLLCVITNAPKLINIESKKINELAIFNQVIDISEASKKKTINKTDNSTSARIELLLAGIDIIRDSYGFGIGGGSTKAKLKEGGGVSSNKLTDLHFYWLEILTDAGIFYFIIYILWYIYMLKKHLFIIRTSQDVDLKYLSFSLLLASEISIT